MKNSRWFILISLVATLSARADRIDDSSVAELIHLAGTRDKEARHALCYRFLYGVGGAEQDYSKALHWCEIAAKTGLPSSQTLLAEMFYRGQGTGVDYARAFDLYAAAANQGHPHAQYMLALMYGRGLGVKQSDDLGLVWLRRAASNGSEPARQLLNQMEKEMPTRQP
jgi:TPR repeat protein